MIENSKYKSKINSLLNEIHEKEEELEDALHNYQHELYYKIEDSKIVFENSIQHIHIDFRIGILKWLSKSNFWNIFTAPIIYMMIIPFLLLDLSITIYQWICFTAYKIKKVERNKHIVIDRYNLSYLNGIEKLNCIYCGYVNGLVSYSREIAARTEQYWCPIKHARKVLDTHRRYAKFYNFAEHEKYHEHVKAMRDALKKE